MFYIQPRTDQVADKWHQIANLTRLPVRSPQPHRGMWHVNAAALNPWSLKAIAAYLARQSKTTRQSWVQATDQRLAQIAEGFTVKADEWELIEAPEVETSGAFVWPSPAHFLAVHMDGEARRLPLTPLSRGNKLLATNHLFAYSYPQPAGGGATSLS